jgi:ATP-dependent Clp protease adaptor protein ClpS
MTEPVELAEIGLDEVRKVVVFDDTNTFDHVIECLIMYCGKTIEEAIKLTWNIHTQGRAIVKEGEYLDLIPVHAALSDNGLTTEIE